MPLTSKCPIEQNDRSRGLILELFRALHHPYIYPVLDLEFCNGHALAVVPFNAMGSLKDLIYKVRVTYVFTLFESYRKAFFLFFFWRNLHVMLYQASIILPDSYRLKPLGGLLKCPKREGFWIDTMHPRCILGPRVPTHGPWE